MDTSHLMPSGLCLAFSSPYEMHIVHVHTFEDIKPLLYYTKSVPSVFVDQAVEKQVTALAACMNF